MVDMEGKSKINLKISEIFLKKIYFLLKPLIPRGLQIHLRRNYICRKKPFYADIWPIDEKAKLPPPEWNGWPMGKQFALVLTHDVETKEGQEKSIVLANLDRSLGFRSSFNFTAKQYKVSLEYQAYLKEKGFEVGVHGLYHNGNMFAKRKSFESTVLEINRYLKEWDAVGFRCPSMYHNLDWIHDLKIEYDSSTFDTDPFEPQPDGLQTIFPLWVEGKFPQKGYLELPYTLPQDFTLFVIMRNKNIDIWKKKLDWIAEKGGMALLITHPDYMNCEKGRCKIEEYPMELYEEFLSYIKGKFEGQYWHALPREMAHFWKEKMVKKHAAGDR